MADSLYRSHSLEKTSSNGEVITSGSLTTWEDNPVSPLNVGDTFQPVPDGPRLKVKRVSINDNVIGLNAGKPVRQWQISVEGDNQSDVSDTTAEDKHSFSFSIEQDNDSVVHSGTLFITANGDNPPANISVGDTINIPGVGRLVCRRISGTDDFNDNGVRVWNVTYECSDAPSEASTHTKYSFSIEDGYSGSMQVSMTVILRLLLLALARLSAFRALVMLSALRFLDRMSSLIRAFIAGPLLMKELTMLNKFLQIT